MAGRGPAPKALEQRRNHHEPLRGEWIALLPLKRRVLPALPKDEAWSPRTVRAWDAWGKDPATATYGPVENQLALDLAYIYEQWVQKGATELAKEIRQRQDMLGLTPKGKQDRRWRVVADEEPARDEDADVVVLRPVS